MDLPKMRNELNAQRRKVSFNTYDITVDELVRRVATKKIEVAPSYQREFRWDAERQSRLVESLFLGIPVPNLFMATNTDSASGLEWEVVDGLQRTLTLVSFAGNADQRQAAGLLGKPLTLTGLEKLTSFNGLTFEELPADLSDLLLIRPMKVTVLDDLSDKRVRFDLFERLNTGGIKLTDQEIRECIFRGPFIELLRELSVNPDFRTVVRVPKRKEKDGTLEECVLRFFAFHDDYLKFDHSVRDFLNNYTAKHAEDDADALRNFRTCFESTFQFLAKCFPEGATRSRSTTPVNYFEGIAVGAALAIEARPDIEPSAEQDWVADKKFVQAITGATNSRPRVQFRIEYARGGFLRNA